MEIFLNLEGDLTKYAVTNRDGNIYKEVDDLLRFSAGIKGIIYDGDNLKFGISAEGGYKTSEVNNEGDILNTLHTQKRLTDPKTGAIIKEGKEDSSQELENIYDFKNTLTSFGRGCLDLSTTFFGGLYTGLRACLTRDSNGTSDVRLMFDVGGTSANNYKKK